MHTTGSTHELPRATPAHLRLGLIFLQCGVVAALLSASVGVARAQPPKKVLVLSTNSGPSRKLSVLARQNGIALVHFNLTAGVSAPRNLADYAAVLAYADDGQGLLSNLTAFMPTVASYVRNGGTLVMAISFHGGSFDKSLMDLFGIAVGNELVKRTSSAVKFAGGDILRIWDGLTVGGYENGYVDGYLDVVGTPLNGVAGPGVSSESGQRTRQIGVATVVGAGRVIAVMQGRSIWQGNACNSCRVAMFDDANLDKLDNAEAIKRLLTLAAP